MTIMSKQNKNTRVLSEKKLRAGILAHLAAGLHLDTQQHTQKGLVRILDERDAATAAVATAKAAYEQAVADEHEVRDATDGIVSSMRAAIHVMFASAKDTLADFGMAPRRRQQPLTLEQKLAARARSKATRAARHVMGKKQRAAIVVGEAPPVPSPPSPPPTPPTPQPAVTPPQVPPTPIAPATPPPLTHGSGSS